MALSKFNKNINYHQSQPDKPTLSPSELKRLFDQAGVDIKQYLNEVLTEEADINLSRLENEINAGIADLITQITPLRKSLKYNGAAPSNLNEATTYGIYSLSGTHTSSPISNTYGVLIVYENRGTTWDPSNAGSWIWQEIRTTNGEIYKRNAVNSSTGWNKWFKEPKERLLFKSSLDTGNTSDSITLNDSISNYEEGEIDYSYGTNAIKTVKFYVRGNSVQVPLDMIYCANSNLQLLSAIVNLSGTTLTRVRAGAKNIVISTNAIANFDNPSIAIHRIVGIC